MHRVKAVLLKDAANAQTVASVKSAAAGVAPATAVKVRRPKAVPKRVLMAVTVNAVNAPPKDAQTVADQNVSHARNVQPASHPALKTATKAAVKTPAKPSREMKA